MICTPPRSHSAVPGGKGMNADTNAKLASDVQDYAARVGAVGLMEVRLISNGLCLQVPLGPVGGVVLWKQTNFHVVLPQMHALSSFSVPLLLVQDLTKVLICERPAEPLTHLAAHLDTGASVTLPSEAGACGTEADASEYLAVHKLPQTLEELMAMLLYARPDDARAFLAAELRKLAASSEGASAGAVETKRDGFFTDDDLTGMFSLFDPTARGYLSREQAAAGARSLGLPEGDAPAGSAAGGGLTADEFAAWARSLLDAHRII